MQQNCQHCGELIVGNAYRVTSEEEGISLLDMIVCSLCSMEAKKLRLRTQKMNVTSKQVSARTRRTHPFTTRYLI
jgi:superfamily II helicase